ncbi:MAG: 1-acyl-sn-glycerol-3-phosphate acyltransferase [Alphaproteobacteria bacterium]|nr:1-acyl-sn-glycerol-3-phosphate acyltransferase [Alphaproteobacteria bacterium]
MPRLRAFVLVATFVVLTLASVPIQYFSLRCRLKLCRIYPHAYHRLLCRMFGIRITVIGKPVEDSGVLFVANHTGYFDILIMSATARLSFVAKREVASWPLFGLMARLQESIFVDRDRRSAAGAARDVLRQRLRRGDALVLFPEGTSTDGNRVLTFKSALMGAVESEIGHDAAGRVRYVPVQPVSITYVGVHGIPLGRENRPLFAWYGDMELLPHVWEAVKAGPLDVVVEFHPPLTMDEAGDRKRIAILAETAVRRGQTRALRGEVGPTLAPAPAADEPAPAEAPA